MAILRLLPLVILSFLHFLPLAAGSSGCQCRRCGNVDIPYPFRLEGPNCSFTNASCPSLSEFKIYCKENASFGMGFIPFLPTYYHREYQILKVFNDHLAINSTWFHAKSCGKEYEWKNIKLLPDGPFTISSSNKFVAWGCFRVGIFANESHYILGGCVPICNSVIAKLPKYCSGEICCETRIPPNQNFFQIMANYQNISQNSSVCAISTIVEPDNYNESNIDNIRRPAGHRSMSIDWAIGNDNCSTAEHKGSLQCSENARCLDAARSSGYLCKCNSGYEGDGYRNGKGCTDINECKTSNNCSSRHARCHNTNGSYKCKCLKGYSGDGFTNGTGCQAGNSETAHTGYLETVHILSAVGVTFTVMVLGVCVLLWISKQRNIKLQRLKYFEQNGGFRFRQLISSNAARGAEGTKLFSLDDLHKATSNFSDNLILGTGGYGTVYKGTLAEGTVVAIKKSKAIDQYDVDQFVNELIILSQINHRNIVKLLGCCLEAPVPLLVYEYISNGTLLDHLDGKYEQYLGWEDRLRIATETAEALAYLHSAASVPIIHRDVKSSNILLDGSYTPKVADFGVSRLVPVDQTHISTVVQGTLGYLDPQYFQTFQLTDKSDVYSFGVVLAELLTGMKPISHERLKNEINLATFFISTLKTKRLMEIIDSRLVDENRMDDMDSVQAVAILAKDCLCPEGERRPSMKEVGQQLLWIRRGRRSGRGHDWLGTNSVSLQNEEESVALINQERSDASSAFSSTLNTGSSVSFSIEGFKGNINSGR